jgi:formylglycine-generating enzyme required for sulfatase activity
MVHSALSLVSLLGVLPFALSQDARPKPGEQREFEIADGVKMKFCWIPPGKATLGSPATEEKRREDEAEHEYASKGFWLAKYPVTQGEYKAVMGSLPKEFKDEPKGDRLPALAYWSHCREFVEKCGMKGLRLPDEYEWEYACRGGMGNKQPFYWGHGLNGDKANCRGNAYGTKTPGPTLEKYTGVGAYEKVAPHPWGLCDMHGNVRDWCFNRNKAEQQDPGILRGGSCHSAPWYCRAASRFRSSDPYSSCIANGFRLLLEAE